MDYQLKVTKLGEIQFWITTTRETAHNALVVKEKLAFLFPLFIFPRSASAASNLASFFFLPLLSSWSIFIYLLIFHKRSISSNNFRAHVYSNLSGLAH